VGQSSFWQATEQKWALRHPEQIMVPGLLQGQNGGESGVGLITPIALCTSANA
jgi:hypothetical protein